jgi:predicted transcriptional regulator
MAKHFYQSYLFKDHDPIIDVIRDLMKKEKLTVYQLHLMSGVSVACLHRWFDGGTMRPQHSTVKAVIRSMGYDYEVNTEVKVQKLGPRLLPQDKKSA